MKLRIGIDVGGTFTDVVAIDAAGATTIAKAASTPADPSAGVVAGLKALAERLGLSCDALLAVTERIVHGTTVATNALLERKGARVAMLTTAGHRDVLQMREGLKNERYDLRLPPPEPLAPRDLRLGIRERIGPDGAVRIPLDPASLQHAIERLRTADVEAVAVCFLHAWCNAAHERAAAAAVAAALPDVFLCCSADVLPEIGEYDRIATTVVNAYVGPRIGPYLARLEDRLRGLGYYGPIYVVHSHGGVEPIAETARLAAATVLSGPAGGVAGALRAADSAEAPDVITFDMGGTSTDVALVHGAEPALSRHRDVAGERIALQSLDIVTVGAGGGSIAHVDARGILAVGPASAGAEPGPACYGRGGTDATVTDANLVLGYLDAERPLGDGRRLDLAAATAAIDRLAEWLGLQREAAAAGVHRVVNARMAEGIRLASVRRGIDPRRFALLAFGGAAGLHAAAIARELGMGRVLVPSTASVFSAWGMLTSDLRYEGVRTHIGDADALDGAAFRALFDELEAEVTARLRQDFAGPIRTKRSADMRYGEQIFDVQVALDEVDWDRGDTLAQAIEAFHRRHEQLFTYAMRGQGVVVVNVRVAAVGALERIATVEARAHPAPRAAETRPAKLHLGGWRAAASAEFDALRPGAELEGPAVIRSETTSVLVPAGDTARLLPSGWLQIEVAVDR